MLARLVAVALFGSLVACGGPSKPAAAPDSDPWADYKGTFAEPVGAHPKAAPVAKVASAEKAAAPAPTAPPVAAAASDPAPAPVAKAAKTKKSKGKSKAKAKKAPDGT